MSWTWSSTADQWGCNNNIKALHSKAIVGKNMSCRICRKQAVVMQKQMEHYLSHEDCKTSNFLAQRHT
ncbi:hypothetical protein TNCV_3302031 [Trichonephila clavipes]|nr:hypothetical protein TNCV_3302031 [Trichonephila clavipes]